MAKPAIYIVDDDEKMLAAVERELRRRYAADYDVNCEKSPLAALEKLQAAQASDQPVALLLSDCWMPEMPGLEYLSQASSLFPHARRALLVNLTDDTSAEVVLDAMAGNVIDSFGLKPRTSPDETFHRLITGLLEEWSREHRPSYEMIRVIGETWARRSHELRHLLHRNGIPFGFYDVESLEAKSALAQANHRESTLPVVILPDGKALDNPTNRELADELNVSILYDISGLPEDRHADLLIVGAGPAGLSAAVYAASEGLHTVIVEREAIGGQAGQSSLIRNYLGFPTGIRGDDLARRAYQQAWLFGADFAFGLEVNGLREEGDQRVVTFTDGTEMSARSVILAMGVRYRSLNSPKLEKLVGAGVYYGSPMSEAHAFHGANVVITGGGNSAGQAVIHLSRYAATVTLAVRGENLTDSMSQYLISEIDACNNINVRYNTEVIDGSGRYRLKKLVLKNLESEETEEIEASALFVMIGAEPKTDWLPPEIARDEDGFILTGRYLAGSLKDNGWNVGRRPLLFEASMPGVFAIGDVRSHSVKRVASAVGEGSIAVSLVHEYLSAKEDSG